MKEHKSDPHNPLIAGAFFRTGDIEAWGRGIDTIRAACREHGSNFPAFESEPTSMMVEFKGIVPDKTDPEITLKTGLAEGLVETSDKGLVETRVETRVEMRVETRAETNARTPERILEQFRKNPKLTLNDVAEAIGKSTSTVERACAKLVQQGRLVHVGPKKAGHWEILEEHP